jgi:hypothetical protein
VFKCGTGLLKKGSVVDPNPNILAGSESEKKSSDLDSDPDTVVK